MQKLSLFISVSLLGGFCIVFTAFGQEHVKKICIPLGSFKVNPPKGYAATKPAVDFPHSSHFDTTCKTCHHNWNYEEQIVGCSTSGCHDQLLRREKGEKEMKGEDSSLRFFRHAYHKSCIECHRSTRRQAILKEKQEGASEETRQFKLVPLGCEDCHK